MTTTTEIYNPFARILEFTSQYKLIIQDELTNENAQAFYSQGWAVHDDTIADLEEFTWQGWERHAEYCIAVFGPSILMAIAAYRIWQNRNAKFLPAPYTPKQPIALLAPAVDEPAFDMSWINWKLYLELLFKMGRFA